MIDITFVFSAHVRMVDRFREKFNLQYHGVKKQEMIATINALPGGLKQEGKLNK